MSPEIKKINNNFQNQSQIRKNKISNIMKKEKNSSKETEMRRGKSRLSETYLHNLNDLHKIQQLNKGEILSTQIGGKFKVDKNELNHSFNANINSAPYLFHSDRKLNFSPNNLNSENIQNMQSKINSYQLRLTGCKKTIYSLEEMIKSKNAEIESLRSELGNKNKYIDQLSNLRSPTRPNLGGASASIQIRNKEKEYQKKIDAKDEIINDLKKQNIRLTEMNSEIVSKLRKYELEYKDLSISNSNYLSKNNEYLKDNIQLKADFDK